MSFLFGSAHYVSKFNPKLAPLCNPLGPVLRKPTKYSWTEEHTVHFDAFKTRIANHTENTHQKPQFETRMKYDAYRSSLGVQVSSIVQLFWERIFSYNRPLSFSFSFKRTMF